MLKETLQKPHVALIAAAIFLVCFVVFGIRGLDTAICASAAFTYGVVTGKREQAVIAAISRLVTKGKTLFQK